MQIDVYASGSSGNCYHISDGQSRLLLECGLPFAKINRATGFSLAGVAGCLVTHEHMDHALALRQLVQVGIPCYASPGTLAALGVTGYHARPVLPGATFRVGSFLVAPFATVHDARQPLGFLLKSTATGEKLLFVTDSAYIPHRFAGLHYIMVECNYITRALYAAEEPAIISRLLRSHMSLETCKRFLLAQDLRTVRRIYLLHISRRRGNPQQMQREVMRATGRETVIA